MNRYEMCRFTGKGGELRVASELLLRNLGISLPEVDVGYDIFTENGCRIQVKSARLRTTAATLKVYKEPVYVYTFQKDKPVVSSSKTLKIKPSRQFVEHCDIVVFFGIDESRFWIVPSEYLKGRTLLYVGKNTKREFSEELESMKKMQEDGMSTYKIAEKIGIKQSSVWKRLNSKSKEKHPGRWTTKVKACENAWDKILNFGKPETNEIQVVGDNKWQTLGVNSQSGLADFLITSTIQSSAVS